MKHSGDSGKSILGNVTGVFLLACFFFNFFMRPCSVSRLKHDVNNYWNVIAYFSSDVIFQHITGNDSICEVVADKQVIVLPWTAHVASEVGLLFFFVELHHAIEERALR